MVLVNRLGQILSRNYFLIQLSQKGSIDLFNDNKYHHSGWRNKRRDKDRGLVNINDYLIVYFTNSVKKYKKEVKYVVEVLDFDSGKQNIWVKPIMKLKGLNYYKIQRVVYQGLLSNKFSHCGQQGFNIVKISESDYSYIIKHIDKIIIKFDDIIDEYDEIEKRNDFKMLYNYKDNLSGLKPYYRERFIEKKYIRKNKSNDGYIITDLGSVFLEEYSI